MAALAGNPIPGRPDCPTSNGKMARRQIAGKRNIGDRGVGR